MALIAIELVAGSSFAPTVVREAVALERNCGDGMVDFFE